MNRRHNRGAKQRTICGVKSQAFRARLSAGNGTAIGSVIALGTAAFLAGCSSQDFGRPVARVADIMDSRKPYMDSRDEDMAKLRSQQIGRMLIAWEKSTAQTDRDYVIGRDDVLEVGILSLDKPDEVTKLLRPVRQDGSIALPLIGDTPAGGLTVRDLESNITRDLNGRFLKDPEVSVRVSDYRSLPVVITGSVTAPGVYYLRRNESSVLEVLSLAQGLSANAGSRLLIVRSKRPSDGPDRRESQAVKPNLPPPTESQHFLESGLETVESPAGPGDLAEDAAIEAQMIEVDIDRLVGEGDIRLNATVLGGDIITVGARKKSFVYVLGYVQTPGSFEIEESARIDALQAVARAGGLAAAARAQNSFLVTERGGARRIIDVDLTKIARGVRPPVHMVPGDTLIVGSGFFAKLGEFIKPSVGVGASLAPVP